MELAQHRHPSVRLSAYKTKQTSVMQQQQRDKLYPDRLVIGEMSNSPSEQPGFQRLGSTPGLHR